MDEMTAFLGKVYEVRMSQAVVVNIPESLYGVLRRIAQATNQPLDAALLKGVESLLPPLTGLSAEMQQDLEALEAMPTAALQRILLEAVPAEVQQALQALLDRHQQGGLNANEQAQLADLQAAADLVMLRKARAAALLRFRGQRLPTLAELRQMSQRG